MHDSFSAPDPPIFEAPTTSNISLFTNENVSLTARYFSLYPFPNVIWLKNDRILKHVDTVPGSLHYEPRFDVPGFQVRSLSLFNVKLSDQGWYQAVIKDGNQSYHSMRVSLELKGKIYHTIDDATTVLLIMTFKSFTPSPIL